MPSAVVRIHDVTADEALELLRARKVDLALTGVDVIHKDLAYEEIVRERFVLLSARKHPVGVDVSVWSEEQLGSLSLISMPRGTGTRQSVEAAFISKGLRFRPVLEFQHLTSIAKFVKTGCGVAVLPLSGAQLVRPRGRVSLSGVRSLLRFSSVSADQRSENRSAGRPRR